MNQFEPLKRCNRRNRPVQPKHYVVKLIFLAVKIIMILSPNTLVAQDPSPPPTPTVTPFLGKSSLPLTGESKNRLESRALPSSDDQSPLNSTWQDDWEAIRQIRGQLQQDSGSVLGELLGDRQWAEQQFDDEIKNLLINEPANTRTRPEMVTQDGDETKRRPMGVLRPQTVQENHGSNDLPRETAKENSNYPAARQLRPLPSAILSHPMNRPFESSGHPTAHSAHQNPDGRNSPQMASLNGRNSPQMATFTFPQRLEPIQTHLPSQGGKTAGLRQIAHRLEHSAAELEMLELYEEADQLRDLAAEMWRKARVQATGQGQRR